MLSGVSAAQFAEAGAQLAEALAVHDILPPEAIAARTTALFARVRLPEPDRIGHGLVYPLAILQGVTGVILILINFEVIHTAALRNAAAALPAGSWQPMHVPGPDVGQADGGTLVLPAQSMYCARLG